MPLCLMESAVFNRRALSTEEAIQESLNLLDTCQRFGGVAVMLWHNVLWDELDHPGWGAHFTATLDAAVEKGARITSLRDGLASWIGLEH